MSDNLVLSAAQERVVDAVAGLAPGASLIVSGYAGVGKSTVLAEVFKRHGAKMVMTPTGKAAARLRAIKTPARTIHSVLYLPREGRKKELQWDLREDDDLHLSAGDLVIVDEASMVGPRIAADLRGLVDRFGLRLVLIGDGFQLPPVLAPDEAGAWAEGFSVMRGDGFETAERLELTEVFRQALDSPVLRAATEIRRGGSAKADAGDSRFVTLDGGPARMADSLVGAIKRGLDVVGITWRNQDRHVVNKAAREQLGRASALPEPGEPLVVLANAKFLDLWNGEVVTFLEATSPPQSLRPYTDFPMGVTCKVRRPDGREQNVLLVLEFLGGGEHQGVTPGVCYREHFGISTAKRATMLLADWGYCLTAHRSQGSEWDVAIVHASGGLFTVPDGWRRWVYTAMTRAKTGLAIVADGPMRAAFGIGGRRLSTSLLRPKDEQVAAQVSTPEVAPERVYFAHSVRDFGRPAAATVRTAIATRWPQATLLDPEKMDLPTLAKARGGWEEAYRAVIHEQVGKAGAVAVLEHMEHVGRGVFAEVRNALEVNIPVWAFRAGRFQRVREVQIVNESDWKVTYGRVVLIAAPTGPPQETSP